MPDERAVLAREIAYHEKLYAEFAPAHFAKPAVRALREHMASRMLRLGSENGKHPFRALSLGCGIGDTEIVMARRGVEVTGLDVSPTAIRHARRSADGLPLRFIEGTIEDAGLEPGSFDLVFAIFFLHHLPDSALAALPGRIAPLLREGGMFYSLDPSRYRLSGAVGKLLFPKLMESYQSPDERQLSPRETAELFAGSGLEASYSYYDFVSSPLAGLFPSWRSGYRAGRKLDEALIRIPGVRRLGSNFEITARRVQ